MARRYQRMNIVACGNCGANYDARGDDPRCPACDARLADFEPGEPRPSVRGFEGILEGPDLMHVRREEKPETAPAEDFIAAALVLVSFVMMVAAVFMQSPLLLTLGMSLFALTGIFFGLYKLSLLLRGKRKKREDAFEAPSMLDWLIGRGFWDRWR